MTMRKGLFLVGNLLLVLCLIGLGLLGTRTFPKAYESSDSVLQAAGRPDGVQESPAVTAQYVWPWRTEIPVWMMAVAAILVILVVVMGWVELDRRYFLGFLRPPILLLLGGGVALIILLTSPILGGLGGSRFGLLGVAGVPTVVPGAGSGQKEYVVVETEWPLKMEVGRSDSIRIALIRTVSGDYVGTVEVEGHAGSVATAIPVGTPGAPIAEAFGTGYRAYAEANLVGTAFELQPVSSARQSLDQQTLVWEWNIVSDRPGEQSLNAVIEVTWEPDDSGEASIVRQLWRSRYEVQVVKPWITTGQISLASALLGFVGTGFNIPWLYERVQEMRGKRKKKDSGQQSTN